MVSASYDMSLRVWDITTGECKNVIKLTYQLLGGNKINAIAFSPDGRFIVVGLDEEERCLRLIDLITGECIHTFEDYEDSIYSVAFSPDGRYVLSGSGHCFMTLWEIDWDYRFPKPSP